MRRFLLATLAAFIFGFLGSCHPCNDVPCETQMRYQLVPSLENDYQLTFTVAGAQAHGSCPGAFRLGEGSVVCDYRRIKLVLPEGKGAGAWRPGGPAPEIDISLHGLDGEAILHHAARLPLEHDTRSGEGCPSACYFNYEVVQLSVP